MLAFDFQAGSFYDDFCVFYPAVNCSIRFATFTVIFMKEIWETIKPTDFTFCDINEDPKLIHYPPLLSILRQCTHVKVTAISEGIFS